MEHPGPERRRPPLAAGETVLVTGATGFVGSQLVRRLIGQAVSVRVLARPGSVHPHLLGLPIEEITGDLSDPALLEAACGGVRAVFHVAGVVSYRPADRHRIWDVNVLGTRRVLDAATRAGVEGVVLTSSVAALGIPRSRQRPAGEGVPCLGRFRRVAYVWSKRQALLESLVRARRGGGPALIPVLPATVLGPGDLNRHAGAVVLGVAKGRAWLAPPGTTSLVDVADVAEGHLLAWERGVSGRPYLLSACSVSYRELQEAVARVLGVRGPRWVLPRAGIFPAMGLGLIASQLGLGLSEQLAQLAFSRREYTADRARHELGWRPRYGLREMIERTARYYRDVGELRL